MTSRARHKDFDPGINLGRFRLSASGDVALFARVCDIPRKERPALDEPTIGLDPIARSGVWDRIMMARAETGMSVLVTTHYMDEADQQCDRIALMHRGRVRAEGTPAELKAMVGDDATLDDVFRATTGDDLGAGTGERMRNVRSARRTARRLS